MAPLEETTSEAGFSKFVQARIDRFYNPSENDSARLAIIRELGKFAMGWLDQAKVPLSTERSREAESVAQAVAFLADHTGRWIKEEAMGPFQARWLYFVESDRQVGGEFGRHVIWRELHRRLTLLVRTGKLSEARRLIGDGGVFRIEDAPPPWDIYLRGTRAGIRRLRGEFQLALDDLDPSTLRIDEGDRKAQLFLALHRFSIETDLGRLERADEALGHITRIIKTQAGPVSPQRKSLLWECRITQLLSTGNHHQALHYATKTLDELEQELLQSLEGMRHRDKLLYLAATAATQADPGREDRAIPDHASTKTLGYLESDSFLDHYTRLTCSLMLVAALHAQGEEADALQQLRSLEREHGTKSGRGRSMPERDATPLFSARLATQRYEIALTMGAADAIEEAGAELQDAFRDLLAIWRSIAIQPSGIGFLQFAERRHALHLVLESTLRAGPNRDERALAWLLSADGCSTVARHLGAAEATPNDIMALCGSLDTTLVCFVATDEGTHRFTVTARGVAHQRLEGESVFRSHFSPVVAALRRRPEPGTTWPPVSIRRHLQWLSKRMIPDDGDGSLLFAGLDSFGFGSVEVLPDHRGIPIGLSREVTQTPSINALTRLRELDLEHRKRPRTGLSLFALTGTGRDMATGQTLPTIRFGLKEYERLTDLSRGRVSFQRPLDLTASGLVAAIESGPDLFMVLTHGSDSGAQGDIPELYVQSEMGGRGDYQVLSADALSARLLASSSSRPGVALIAACSAGAGPRRMGDSGASDFSGALLQSGAPTVLTARERIDQEAAIAFLMAFSREYLGAGQTAGRATLLARQAVASIPRFSHPHFWASIQLFGWSGTQVR